MAPRTWYFPTAFGIGAHDRLIIAVRLSPAASHSPGKRPSAVDYNKAMAKAAGFERGGIHRGPEGATTGPAGSSSSSPPLPGGGLLDCRDILYHRLIYDYAQKMYNSLGSAAVENIGAVTVDGQGDIMLHSAEAYTHRRGERRLFFRTERLRPHPGRDAAARTSRLRVMRVDLFRPEIYVRRETGGEWNVEWAFLPPPRPAEEPAPAPEKDDPWKDYLRADDGFPRNGVHVHDGTIHVTFVGKTRPRGHLEHHPRADHS